MEKKEPNPAASKPKQLSDDQMATLFQQLYISAHSGLDLTSAIGLITDALPKTHTGAFSSAQNDAACGIPISEIFRKTSLFPDHALNMLEISELSGRQEQVFRALGDYYQKQADLKRMIRQAVAYPVVMSVIISAIFLILVSQVMPIFNKISGQLGLPQTKLSVLLTTIGGASNLIFTILAAAALFAAVAGTALFKTGRLRETDLVRGKIAIMTDQARFSSAIALLLASGTHIETAFQKACGDVQSKIFRKKLDNAEKTLEHTGDIATAIMEHNIFDPMDTALIRTACRAGSVDSTMERISAHCQSMANDALCHFLERLQYILIIALCSAIGLVLLSVIAPMVDLLTSIG